MFNITHGKSSGLIPLLFSTSNLEAERRWLKASPSTKILVKWGRWQRRQVGAERLMAMDRWTSMYLKLKIVCPTKWWSNWTDNFWMKKNMSPIWIARKCAKKDHHHGSIARTQTCYMYATCAITCVWFFTFWHSMCLKLVKLTGSLTRCEWHLKRSSSVKISFDSTTPERLLMLAVNIKWLPAKLKPAWKVAKWSWIF